ncbi:hypothetical protein GCM10025734_04850 [Kitasatospora paranensis]|uniref:hypothetical protein n=1 Tax=Kitasatospora paranensis TaxID=258053 RepID=UPI0031E87B18
MFLAVIGLIGFTLYWWVTMWVLLAGRMSWRSLLPSACATGVYYLGMGVVFSFVASGMVRSNSEEYGPIGVVFVLMSWLIGLGVVIILGAVTGTVWRDREMSLAGAVRRMLRRTRPRTRTRKRSEQ